MKKTCLLLITLTGIIFSACFKTEDAPVLTFDGEANMTIAEFQKLHNLSTNPPTLIDTAVIISGIVTSTDQYGSCYKEIFFQDSTGGISIRINNTSYYMKYRIGQRIFVKAKGLYLGNYASGDRTGFYQIGMYGNENGGLNYISAKAEMKHIFRSGFTEAPPAPKIIANAEEIVKGPGGDYHTLVKLVNCSFIEANGETKYFEASGTVSTISRNIKLNTGANIEARISKQCNFANDILPTGTLNIEGLLTKFADTHQLIIRSANDVHPPPSVKILKIYDMVTNPMPEWTIRQITGRDPWIYFADSKYVKIQPPAGNDTECWLISPKLNFAGEKNVALVFTYRIIGEMENNAQVRYTIDGTNWERLDFKPLNGNVEAMLKLDEKIILNPNLQIAFQYKTTDKYPTWYILNIAFKANAY